MNESSSWVRQQRGRIIDTLIHAMEDKRRVLILYRSVQAPEPQEQEVGPQGLIWHHGSLYLIAWSAKRNDIRNFKVERIEFAERMQLQVTKPTAVMKWVLSFVQNATVLGPEKLIDAIRDELSVLMDRYQPSVVSG